MCVGLAIKTKKGRGSANREKFDQSTVAIEITCVLTVEATFERATLKTNGILRFQDENDNVFNFVVLRVFVQLNSFQHAVNIIFQFVMRHNGGVEMFFVLFSYF